MKLTTQKAHKTARERGQAAYEAAKAKKYSETMAHELKEKAETIERRYRISEGHGTFDRMNMDTTWK